VIEIGVRSVRGESVTYVHDDHIGSSVYIRCGEAEQANAGADEAVLAAVVINQPITMIGAVVFDCQALMAVEQIWTAHEPALIIVNRNLNLRPWEAGQHKEHSKPGFHCGLGLRLGQVNNAPKASDALSSQMVGDMSAQLGDGNQPGMEEHVRSDHPVC
jgi:hypothetical protein